MKALAVLLGRPSPPNVETVNDKDAYLPTLFDLQEHEMGAETTGSGPCRRLRFNPATGEILRHNDGTPKVAEIVEPPKELLVCGQCYQRKIPRSQVEFTQGREPAKLRCTTCRLNGKLPKLDTALPRKGKK